VIKKEADNRNSVIKNVKAKVIPVKKGTTETTPKLFKKHQSNKPGKHEIKPPQRKQPCWALHTYCGKY